MYLGSSIIDEIHVLLAVLVMFILLPLWAIRRVKGEGWMATYMITAGVAFWAAVATILSYAGLVRYAVLFVVVVGALVVTHRLGQREAKPKEGPTGHFWDLFESPGPAWRNIKQQVSASLAEWWNETLTTYGVVGIILMVVAVGWALVYGSYPLLRQADPGTPQGYVNLLRIASLATNSGVYASGSAPLGLPALGASLATAFFLPSMDVLRFLYPVADVFTVIAVGAVTYQLTKVGQITALAMFLVSVSSIAHFGFPINFESPLTLHWALIMVIMAITQALAFQERPTRTQGTYIMLSLLAASLISPPVAVVGYLVAMMVLGRPQDPEARVAVVYTGVSSAVGVLFGGVPLAIGYATGHPLSPDGWLLAPFPALTPLWHNAGQASDWIIFVALVLVVVSRLSPKKSPRSSRLALAMGMLAIVAGLFGHLSVVASTILWSDILGLMVLVMALDLLLTPILNWFHSAVVTNVVMIVVALLGLATPASAVTLTQYAPPLAGEATSRIENSFPPYQWTIISPVQQYSEVLGKGWQMEIASFVTEYSLKDAENAHYELDRDAHYPILTPDIFLYVEPRIFPSGRRVTRQDLTLPLGSGNSLYQGASLRGIEARAYYWALAYHRSHPRTSEFYVKSPNLMVLWIRQ